MKRIASLLLAGPCLACAPSAETQERLALACEMQKCRCVIQEKSMFSPARYGPVHWKADGSAYCPEGQYLELDDDSRP